MSIVQPSSMTNKNSFSGIEIVTGDNIIMPIAKRTFEVNKVNDEKGNVNQNTYLKSFLKLPGDEGRDDNDKVIRR